MIQITVLCRTRPLFIGAALFCAMTGLAAAEAQSDQSSRSTEEKPAQAMPGTQRDVIAPPHVGDTDLNKGTPRGADFPTPVIPPPTSPAPAKPETPH
jgi:hypothetical protein